MPVEAASSDVEWCAFLIVIHLSKPECRSSRHIEAKGVRWARQKVACGKNTACLDGKKEPSGIRKAERIGLPRSNVGKPKRVAGSAPVRVVAQTEEPNESIHGRIVTSIRGQLVGCSTGDGEICLRVPLVSPKSCDSERLILKLFSQVIPEAA